MALSSVAVVHISNLLEKMTSTDKDFRFMATNDLMNELQKDSIKLDDDCERKVVKQLLKLLEDKNGEVQNLAVKCLGPLVTKVKDPQVDLIVDSLCSNMSSNEAKEQLRDVSSVGLKTVIGELPPSANSPLATAMCRRITPRLVTAVNNGKNVAIQLEALDILADLLLRFTSIMQPHHEVVLDALLPQLSSPRLAVRKRCIMALSHLVTSCSQPHFETAMDFLTTELKKNTDSSTTRTYVNAIAAVSRAAGHRFGVYLSAVMPLLVRYCDAETVEKNQDGGDDELREFCIQAFESFVARCPREVESHIDEIVRLCCLFLCYDPNYHYGDDDGGDSSMDGDYSNDGSDEDEQDYSDDEDMSWKVRRAAAKCLEAVLLTRRERLADMYKEVSPLLVSRFKEREENVKCDVFTAFIALLKHTKLTLPSSMQTDVRSLDMHSAQTPPAGNSVPFVFRAAADENHHDMEVDASTESQLCALLATQVPGVVRAIKGQLRDKSIKTRQSCFAVLTELLQVLPGCLSEHLTLLVPGIQLSLTDAHATSHSKIDTLNFIHVALLTHEPSVFQPHANVLVPLIVRVTGDTYYKVVSEALLVLQQFIRLLRQSTSSAAVSAEYAPLLETIYSAVFAKLQTVEADQEVKEKAIACSGQLVASFGDVLEKKLTQILPFFVDRLNNEITRLAAVRALTVIANSPLHVEVSSILSEVMLLLATFLRKNQRALKVSSLLLLNALFSHHRSSFSPEALDTVLSEMPPLIAEGDMQIAQHTVRLITLLLEFAPQSISALLISEILPRVFRLVESSLCQGASLTAAIDLFRSCVTTPSLSPPLNCMDLCSQLMTPMMPAQGQQPMGHDRLHKEGYRNIARCVAAVTEVANPNNSKAIVKMLTAQVSDPNSSDCVQFFGLLALGEIGRLKSSVLEDAHIVENIILPAFSSQKEDLQRAASQALGAVAVGNLSKYMPVVLKEISKQPRRQYLLLISLKEIISAESVDSFAAQNIMQPHMSGVWEVLMEHAVAKEEGTRNVVSECLGKLCLIDPGALLPQLRKTLSNESPLARATTVAALQYTIVETPQPIDSLLRTCISEFLNALHDDDLTVRRVALGTLNSAAHNKPSLVRDLLPTLLPAVYKETKVVKELIREVEMGPFKHMVDDGLDLRKSAFETMYTLLESCLERLDILEFIQHVEHGLLDHYDIKMLTYLMVSRLTALCPTHVLQRLEFIVEPLKQACTTKVKPNAVKQEFEKQDELKRAAIRAFTALQAVPDADRNPQFNDFLGLIRATPDLKQMYDAVHRDPKGSYADHHEMDTT